MLFGPEISKAQKHLMKDDTDATAPQRDDIISSDDMTSVSADLRSVLDLKDSLFICWTCVREGLHGQGAK